MRRLLPIGLAGLVAVALVVSSSARAQDYPSQDIHLVSGFPAGSGADLIVRYVAEKLKPLTGRTVVVENRIGAQGNIATEYTARAKPDGYTMYVGGGSGVSANMHLFKNPPVDVPKALVAPATLHRQAFMIVVDAKRPWKTIADLTAYLKEQKDKASYASAAAAGAVLGEVYKQSAGLETVQVVYKTAQDSLNDITSGAIAFGAHDPLFALGQLREGRLRVLAVSAGKRMESSPDLPTMTEQGVPMDLTAWWGVFVPAATPKPVVEKINGWINQILKLEESRQFFNTAGGDPFISTPEEAQAMLLKSVKDWGDYVRIAKIPQM